MILLDLTTKIVFVTGASRGIGAATVLRLAEAGASVAFSYHRSEAQAQALVGQLALISQKNNIQYAAYQCDVSEKVSVENTFATFLRKFGRLDILVNNAGIIRDGLVAAMPEEDWQDVLQTNLTAAFWHTQLALRVFIPQRSGSIINISSVSGLHGNAGQANYAASKAGLIALTEATAKEVGSRKIRCNAIAPGVIETDMSEVIRAAAPEKIKYSTALHRTGKVEEVANVVLFLASDLSSFVTGQTISVCGGMSS